MKKSLIALAALATVATAAQAQSSVSVYGILDAGVRYDSGFKGTPTASTPAGDQWSFAASPLTTSRFGFRGTEDIGGGIKANFQLESGISPASGATSQVGTSLFDRIATVGVSGSFGAVNFGRQLNAGAIYGAQAITDPLGQQLDGASASGNYIAGAQGVIGSRINQSITILGATNSTKTTRADGMIGYVKDFGPLNIRAGYAMGGVAGDSEAKTSYNLGASFTEGPIAVAGAYFSAKDASNKELKYYSLGGRGSYAGLTFTAGYHELTADAGYAPQTSASANNSNLTIDSTKWKGALFNGGTGAAIYTTGATEAKAKVWNVGVAYNFTPALKSTFAYYNGDYSGSNQAAAAKSGTLDTYVLLNVYSLSKRTDLYGMVDYTKGKRDVVGNGKDDNTGFTVGVRHNF